MDVGINFSADIEPGIGLANIKINMPVARYVQDMYARYSVEVRNYSVPVLRTVYILNDVVRITVGQDGIISAIGCNERYEGKVAGLELFPGQKFCDIRAATNRQRIFNGSLIVDEDFGLSFVLPPPYDEVADTLEDIPGNLVLPEIYVADFSSWRV